MSTGATPLFGTITWLDSRQTDRDPADHGIDLALELRIDGQPDDPAAARAADAPASRPWNWLHLLPFVGHRH